MERLPGGVKEKIILLKVHLTKKSELALTKGFMLGFFLDRNYFFLITNTVWGKIQHGAKKYIITLKVHLTKNQHLPTPYCGTFSGNKKKVKINLKLLFKNIKTKTVIINYNTTTTQN